MKNIYIAEGAKLIDDVTLSKGCSVWYNAVIRADDGPVFLGENTNIQDLVMIHSAAGFPVTTGKNVSVGHGAILHGCTIGSNVLIYTNSVIRGNTVVGDRAWIGSTVTVSTGARVEEDAVVKDGSVVEA
jgi:carbonic anhydrase/acetyltransferase-like protein (isoleucine patch superfamily)